MKIFEFLKRLKDSIKKSFEKKTTSLDALGKFIGFSLAYGVVLNYSLWAIFKIPFSIFRFPAYGILFYFLKEELTEIIKSLKEPWHI